MDKYVEQLKNIKHALEVIDVDTNDSISKMKLKRKLYDKAGKIVNDWLMEEHKEEDEVETPSWLDFDDICFDLVKNDHNVDEMVITVHNYLSSGLYRVVYKRQLGEISTHKDFVKYDKNYENKRKVLARGGEGGKGKVPGCHGDAGGYSYAKYQ